MAGQLELFDHEELGNHIIVAVIEDNDLDIELSGKKCGACASMDTSLPGCHPLEIGRCINPNARSYYLLPENTRPNLWLKEGDPSKYPEGGSWAYVSKDSSACPSYQGKARSGCLAKVDLSAANAKLAATGPSDYHEDWEPSNYSCWDCAHIELPMKANEPNRCILLNIEVDRTAGICSKHTLIQAAEYEA
jgi:hypothetical protein